MRVGLHHGDDLGLAREAVRLEVRNRLQRVRQHVAVRGQDGAHVVLRAHLVQEVERIQVVGHIAVRRVDHGGAAIEDVVAREQ